MKRSIDTEILLQWAYRDELPKRQISSAEGIWNRIADYGQHGGIDPGHGAAQRYPHFGLPHPDALSVERAVGALPDADIDWTADAKNILGDLVALAGVNSTDPQLARRRRSRVTWIYPRSTREGARDRSLQEETLEPPRDVMLVRSLHTKALITMHARMGTRPNWREEMPSPGPTSAERGPNAKVIGECRGKNLYATGSYCPVRWSPSPVSIAEARADYLAWWRGMKQLAETLDLDTFKPLPPTAPEMPWQRETTAPVWIYRARVGDRMATLALKPERKLAGPPEPRKRYPARRIGSAFPRSDE